MSRLFDTVQLRKPKLNKFDMSHERKFSLNMGSLIPILVQDIVPGDKFHVKSEIMMRFAPMLAPVMHRVNVYTHYFFVPNRLVWDEWEEFITGGVNGTSAPATPWFDISTTTAAIDPGVFELATLCDYMGVPRVEQGITVNQQVAINALPFRAYQLIYDEYYRDQNLTASLDISKASGNVGTGGEFTKLTTLRKRAWEKDYFTSSLPWAQRGSAVLIPMEGDADVTYHDQSMFFKNPTGFATAGAVNIETGTGALRDSTNTALRVENIDEVTIANTSITINDLRRSIRLQEWLEKNARGGARYVEQILSHFGVVSSDARLQRPEYLGGGKQPCVISEVLSTFEDASGEPQGNMAGHGVSVGNTNGFSRRFEEHGFVIGLISVLPRTAYQQGIPKILQRFTKFDYFWPEFANLGEQAVLNSEIYYDPAAMGGPGNATFGYQSRYADYKWSPSTVHGDFKTNLAYWHMGRIFAAQPALNTSFVESDPTTRIFAVTETEAQHLWCQIYNRVDALRPMPYFGTPSL